MLKVIILKKLEVVRKDTGLAVRWQEGSSEPNDG